MLVDPIYTGSGIGNQLFCYCTIRCLAEEKGYEFRVAFPERWKGFFFKNIELPSIDGIEVLVEGGIPSKLPEGLKYYRENSSGYDPFVLNIPDNYVLHGNLQYADYLEKYKDKIKKWLEVEPLDLGKDVCILVYRGGEYKYVPEFYLHRSYWLNAMENMRKVNPNLTFKVVTDDPEEAKRVLPELEVSHEMSMDYRMINNAEFLILSNSTFAWFPAFTSSKLKYCIYPKYYGRHNVSDGYWLLETNITKGWLAQDRDGKLFDYDTCKKEIKEYNNRILA
jgi:hypothetical protein